VCRPWSAATRSCPTRGPERRFSGRDTWFQLDRCGPPARLLSALERRPAQSARGRLAGSPSVLSTSTWTRKAGSGQPLWGRFAFSRDEANFALVSDGENSDLVLRYQEAVQSDVACRTVRNHKFADVAVNAPPQQRVSAKIVDGRSDRLRSRYRCVGVLFPQNLKGSLRMSERPCRINYRRQGFGRSVAVPCARRVIQACTSSAR
jgi:hypothetical protein